MYFLVTRWSDLLYLKCLSLPFVGHTVSKSVILGFRFRGWWCNLASDPGSIDSGSGLVIWDSNWVMKDFLCLVRISYLSWKQGLISKSQYQCFKHISYTHVTMWKNVSWLVRPRQISQWTNTFAEIWAVISWICLNDATQFNTNTNQRLKCLIF